MPASASDATEHDLHAILSVQALRAFVYGFASVILGTTLARGGLSDTQVGLVFTSMLVGNALMSIVVGTVGDRIGRRRVYAVLLGVMGVAGGIYAFARALPILVAVALTGTLSTDANESGPITSIEQAMLGAAPAAARARVFGRYNAVAYVAGAVGALSAGGPALLRRSATWIPSDQRWLLVFAGAALVCVVLALRLSETVEHRAPSTGRPLERSRSTVARLAALFGLDAFAGGFVVSTFVAYWFATKFGAGVETMGTVFFAVGLLQAGSSILSGRLAGRIGLLNTMVFSHLPSNLLLALVPFMPTLPSAIAMLLIRSILSQMDVPARQAYVVSMVDPQERTAAAAYTNTARYLVRPFGSFGAGVLMERVALGAPFVLAGALKIVYDLALYAVFRRVRLPEHTPTTIEGRPEADPTPRPPPAR
jgi:predicted MFS family arabinose efflux permease